MQHAEAFVEARLRYDSVHAGPEDVERLDYLQRPALEEVAWALETLGKDFGAAELRPSISPFGEEQRGA